MQTLEIIGLKTGMKWVMLTVLKDNRNAVQFYMERMKYDIDVSSPSMSCADAPYEILSKCLDRKLASEPVPEDERDRRLAARAALAVVLSSERKAKAEEKSEEDSASAIET